MFKGLFGGLFGKSKSESHYEKEADKASSLFQNLPPPPVPFAEEVGEDEEPDGEAELPPIHEPNIEVVEFAGDSEDIDWMHYNHDNGEMVVKFFEHGRESKHAHTYTYSGVPLEAWEALKAGEGPFPSGRDPHYLKGVSVGQNMNFYIRDDHADDLYVYTRLDREQ